MQKLLLVDDERNVLNALRRELRDSFETEEFDDPIAAIERSAKSQFDLVIADYRMPHLNGIDFLKQFGQLQPDASRLLLSGEADINALIRTINETHVYRFIAKPWNKNELVNSIRQALSYRDAIATRRRLAAERMLSGTAPPFRGNAQFHIVLVNGDDYLLRLIAKGLTDENGQENLYSVIQREIQHAALAKEFKCVVESLHTAKSGLAHVGTHPCDLVISAQTLPDMDGVDFLSKIRRIKPDAASILVSNEPNKSLLTRAINEAEVNGFLQLQQVSYEPRADARRQAWNLHQIKTAAIQALACRELLPRDACA